MDYYVFFTIKSQPMEFIIKTYFCILANYWSQQFSGSYCDIWFYSHNQWPLDLQNNITFVLNQVSKFTFPYIWRHFLFLIIREERAQGNIKLWGNLVKIMAMFKAITIVTILQYNQKISFLLIFYVLVRHGMAHKNCLWGKPTYQQHIQNLNFQHFSVLA